MPTPFVYHEIRDRLPPPSEKNTKLLFAPSGEVIGAEVLGLAFSFRQREDGAWIGGEAVALGAMPVDEDWIAAARQVALDALRRHLDPMLFRCPTCSRLITSPSLTAGATLLADRGCVPAHAFQLTDGRVVQVAS